ncbi:Metallo-dependent phosphatase, partial [Metschnikowia bicuspidata var. bicuspidata NRRL YB-4993]
RVMLILATYWMLVVHVFERVRVRTAMDTCQWEKWENWTGDQALVAPHRVAFLADPQLVDDHTYPKMPRVLNYLVRKMSDNYHYLNYKYLQEILDPHTTVFIGDLFDGGRDWQDGPWLEEFHRFCRIFPEKRGRKSYRGLPGNHDIGFQNVSPDVAQRFASYFGEPNDVYILGNHTFIQLDTISLSHEDPRVHTAPRQFLEHAKTLLDPSFPRVVLTHVPLYRDPHVETCAPGRESKNPFPLMRGVEYQTAIEYPFSEDILRNLKPVLVFSGDDHDYCDMTHLDYADNTKRLAREISCKTNSMTNGIKRPAVQLLSLNNPQDGIGNTEKTYETTMCYLPSPYLGVKVY